MLSTRLTNTERTAQQSTWGSGVAWSIYSVPPVRLRTLTREAKVGLTAAESYGLDTVIVVFAVVCSSLASELRPSPENGFGSLNSELKASTHLVTTVPYHPTPSSVS